MSDRRRSGRGRGAGRGRGNPNRREQPPSSDPPRISPLAPRLRPAALGLGDDPDRPALLFLQVRQPSSLSTPSMHVVWGHVKYPCCAQIGWPRAMPYKQYSHPTCSQYSRVNGSEGPFSCPPSSKLSKNPLLNTNPPSVTVPTAYHDRNPDSDTRSQSGNPVPFPDRIDTRIHLKNPKTPPPHTKTKAETQPPMTINQHEQLTALPYANHTPDRLQSNTSAVFCPDSPVQFNTSHYLTKSRSENQPDFATTNLTTTHNLLQVSTDALGIPEACGTTPFSGGEIQAKENTKINATHLNGLGSTALKTTLFYLRLIMTPSQPLEAPTPFPVDYTVTLQSGASTRPCLFPRLIVTPSKSAARGQYPVSNGLHCHVTFRGIHPLPFNHNIPTPPHSMTTCSGYVHATLAPSLATPVRRQDSSPGTPTQAPARRRRDSRPLPTLAPPLGTTPHGDTSVTVLHQSPNVQHDCTTLPPVAGDPSPLSHSASNSRPPRSITTP